jgi:hypothetical protein
LLFTNGAWLNGLDGFPVTYGPVTLGNSVWLPWRVSIMPGTTIGDGSVIGANSLVQGTIPPMSLAVGSPAKVIRSAPDFPRVPSEEKRAAIVAEMVSEFERYVTYEHYVVEVRGGTRSYRPAAGGGPLRLLWRRTPGDALAATTRGDTVLTEVALADDEKSELRANGVHVQCHADALQRGQADPDRALHEDGVVIGRLRRKPAGEGAVMQRDSLDLDAVADDADGWVAGRETDDAGFHAGDFRPAL